MVSEKQETDGFIVSIKENKILHLVLFPKESVAVIVIIVSEFWVDPTVGNWFKVMLGSQLSKNVVKDV